MNVREFLYEFDIMWNNIMSNQAPGLSPYEKSIFCTQAQEAVVKGIYNGTLTTPFESTEEAREYLSKLVQQGHPTKLENQANYPHITSGTILYDLENIKNDKGETIENPWFITYEGVLFDTSSRCSKEEGIVKPVTQDTFWETHRNPFRKDNSRRVLRLTLQADNKNLAELITEYKITKYFIRYIRKPYPIILDNLANYNITIDGKTLPLGCAQEQNIQDSTIMNSECCELNDNIHRVILEMAVKLAQQAWVLTRQKSE